MCLGYKGYVIKEYFANYFLHASDVTFDLARNTTEIHHAEAEPWRVTLVDTGERSMTGGRLRRVRDYVSDERFCFTYGDAVADVDVTALIAHHEREQRLATVTAVQPPGRWGAFEAQREDENDRVVVGFEEKPPGDADGAWINGGFFASEPAVLDYIDHDGTHWEVEPMERLAARTSSPPIGTGASGRLDERSEK